MAMGRSSDGGFYLAGFNTEPRIDWESVSWHTATVADEMSQLAAEAGLEEVSLSTVDDIDSLVEAWRLLLRPTPDAAVRRLRLALRSILLAADLVATPVLPHVLTSPRTVVSPRAPPVAA